MKLMMKIILLVFGLQEAAAVTHSLKYLITGSSQVPNFPEFVEVGMVDDAPIYHYDSDSGKGELKQDWMDRYTAEDPQWLEAQTARSQGWQQWFKANIDIAKRRFNQTGGVHIVQHMYGCLWDEDSGELNGFYQFGYDGEDFISLDLKTQTWVAPVQQAIISRQKWDSDRVLTAQEMNYLTEICPEWLKKYLNYGRSSLMRTVPPSVSLLQRSSSSFITCHATGFHPDRAEMVWKKNGEELHEGVYKGEILPNNDGTFQMSVDLDLSALGDDDWDRYSCVFQLAGVNDTVTRLTKGRVRPNESCYGFLVGPVVVFGVILLLLSIIAAAITYIKRRNKGFKRANTSEDSNPEKEPIEAQNMINSTAKK